MGMAILIQEPRPFKQSFYLSTDIISGQVASENRFEHVAGRRRTDERRSERDHYSFFRAKIAEDEALVSYKRGLLRTPPLLCVNPN